MWCTVYVLYRKGKRIPAEVAKANPRTGWLHMRSKEPHTGMPESRAFLLPEKGASTHFPILELDCCHLRAIDGGGIRLTGFDPRHPSSWTLNHQSWWIIPGITPGARP